MVSHPTFDFFPCLPTEIRLQIWSESFSPRVVELHARRTHYVDNSNADAISPSRRPPAFQSRSFNPAALSVNTEARSAAFKVYNLALPLALETNHVRDEDKPSKPKICDQRVLYLALDRDTLVLLAEQSAARVVRLMNWIRQQDRGAIHRFCISAGYFTHALGAQMLRIIGREVFHDVDNFGLVIGSNARRGVPPDWWRGGTCALREFPSDEGYDEDDGYGEFVAGIGHQFREKNGWMAVGKKEMQIVSLRFEHGW